MNLYKISRKEGETRWEEYEEAVVVAESSEDAKHIHPDSTVATVMYDGKSYDWTTLDNINVEYIGVAAAEMERGVVVASYRDC